MDEFDLKQWTIFFVRNKDIFEKKLERFEDEDTFITFYFKDRIVTYLVLEYLDDSSLKFCHKDGYKSIVCQASKKNLKFIVDNWNDFKKVKDLIIILADVEGNRRMMLKPHIHDLISDSSNLKAGLESVYDNTF